MSEKKKSGGNKIKKRIKKSNLLKDMSLLNEIQILLRSHPCLCTSITMMMWCKYGPKSTHKGILSSKGEGTLQDLTLKFLCFSLLSTHFASNLML